MKRSPLVVIFTTVFIDLVGFGIVIPVLPFYAEGTRFNATPRTVGLLFASYSIMQLIFSPVLGRLSDKYGRRPVLLISIIGTGIGFLILGFATTLWMLFVGRILDGITGGNISTAQAYIADITTKEDRAKGMGLFGAAFGLGLFLARQSAEYSAAGVWRCPSCLRPACALQTRLFFILLCQKLLRRSSGTHFGSGRTRPVAIDRVAKGAASGIRADHLFYLHRRFLDYDHDVFAVHDVSLWL